MEIIVPVNSMYAKMVQGQPPNAAHRNQSIWLQSFKYDKEAQNILKTWILYSLVRTLLWVNVLKVFLK